MTQPSRPRLERFSGLAILCACAAAPAGCCQPGTMAAQQCCPPVAAAPAAVRYGDVCSTPAAGAGSSVVVQSTPSRVATMADAPRPRVVVSEPTGRLAGRSGWRRSDPEGVATRLEGAVDDDVIRR